ncbi:ras guanine nucleotide exchange factor, partial [Capsaspora owczarzaki ATCC 30864]|uniref:Ras guanine nucleotide exchange factor n=1 Tax=Capsaspora owczarzaki (strain ATCC 30864) TaxID=595528 RepID=A0A0D2X4N8_CAPO3
MSRSSLDGASLTAASAAHAASNAVAAGLATISSCPFLWTEERLLLQRILRDREREADFSSLKTRNSFMLVLDEDDTLGIGEESRMIVEELFVRSPSSATPPPATNATTTSSRSRDTTPSASSTDMPIADDGGPKSASSTSTSTTLSSLSSVDAASTTSSESAAPSSTSASTSTSASASSATDADDEGESFGIRDSDNSTLPNVIRTASQEVLNIAVTEASAAIGVDTLSPSDAAEMTKRMSQTTVRGRGLSPQRLSMWSMYYEGKMDLLALLDELGDLEDVEREYLSNALESNDAKKAAAGNTVALHQSIIWNATEYCLYIDIPADKNGSGCTFSIESDDLVSRSPQTPSVTTPTLRVTATLVEKDKLAERCGVHVGDTVMVINGNRVEDLSPQAITDTLADKEHTLSLILRRPLGSQQQGTVVLDEWLSPVNTDNIWLETTTTGQNMLFEDAEGKIVKAGSLNALVSSLTSNHDPNFVHVFMVTFKSFTTMEELLKKLFQRYFVPEWVKQRQNNGPNFDARVQFLVCNVLKKLINDHWADFTGRSILLMREFLYRANKGEARSASVENVANAFAGKLSAMDKRNAAPASSPAPSSTNTSPAVSPIVAQRKQSIFKSADPFIRSNSSPTMQSILPSLNSLRSLSGSSLGLPGQPQTAAAGLPAGQQQAGAGNTEFVSNLLSPVKSVAVARPSPLNFRSEDIAAQITLVDSMLFRRIKFHELLDQSWSRDKLKHLSPNVLGVIKRFNDVSNWCAFEVLSEDKASARGDVIAKFIKILVHLRTLNNFSSIISIIAGLNCAGVVRLKHSYSAVPKKYLDQLVELTELMSHESSYRNYRQQLVVCGLPCVPYLGLSLSDLTFMDDGNPNKLDGLINFSKRRLVQRVIESIRLYQLDEYPIQPDPVILQMIDQYPRMTEDEMYKRSIEVEPRGGQSSQRRPTLLKKQIKKLTGNDRRQSLA